MLSAGVFVIPDEQPARNASRGRNYDLERRWRNFGAGCYCLLTASLFDSQYKVATRRSATHRL